MRRLYELSLSLICCIKTRLKRPSNISRLHFSPALFSTCPSYLVSLMICVDYQVQTTLMPSSLWPHLVEHLHHCIVDHERNRYVQSDSTQPWNRSFVKPAQK